MTARKTVGLLIDEPAGFVTTKIAGRTTFHATLTWRNPTDMPKIAPIRPLTCEEYRRIITETEDREAAHREISGEVAAFESRELSRLLEETLRTLTEFAALSDAVLEVRTVRVSHPFTVAPGVVRQVARDLCSGGHRVEVAPSWSRKMPPDAVVGVGVGEDFSVADFVLSLPAWTIVGSES